MMSGSLYMFEDCNLAPEFRFPDSYVLASRSGTSNIEPWWFLAEEPAKAALFFRILNVDLGATKCLLPFARNEDESGDLACFDADDFSGNPKVYFWAGEKSLREVDWDSRYHLADFADWLRSVSHGE